MLSKINPMGESGRGHRYAVTAAWFVAGAVVGGVTLGAAAALFAVAWGALDLSSTAAPARARCWRSPPRSSTPASSVSDRRSTGGR